MSNINIEEIRARREKHLYFTLAETEADIDALLAEVERLTAQAKKAEVERDDLRNRTALLAKAIGKFIHDGHDDDILENALSEALETGYDWLLDFYHDDLSKARAEAERLTAENARLQQSLYNQGLSLDSRICQAESLTEENARLRAELELERACRVASALFDTVPPHADDTRAGEIEKLNRAMEERG